MHLKRHVGGARGRLQIHLGLGLLANPTPHTPHALLYCVRKHRCGFEVTRLDKSIGRRHHEYTHAKLGRFTSALTAVNAVRRHFVDQAGGQINPRAIAAAAAAAAAAEEAAAAAAAQEEAAAASAGVAAVEEA